MKMLTMNFFYAEYRDMRFRYAVSMCFTEIGYRRYVNACQKAHNINIFNVMVIVDNYHSFI